MTDINFENIISNDYKIFIDTSSLLQDSSEIVFFRIIAPLLHLHKKKIIVPKSVYNELYKHKDSKKIKNINSGIRIMSDLIKNELCLVEKKFDDQFADNAIISLFSSLRLKYNLCLITNDNSYRKDGNLSQDILDLKNARSVEKIKDIVVFYVKDNNIIKYKNGSNQGKTHKYNDVTKKHQMTEFRIPTHIETGEFPNKISLVPFAGDYVFDKFGKKYYLKKQLGRTGGEGSVYLIDNNDYVCKIYKAEKNTNFKLNKITLMTEKVINLKGVCIPEVVVYNKNNEFVGYLMKKAEGAEIKTSIFIPPLLKKKFPHWTRLHLAVVALTILDVVKNLHTRNIILGDINPSNILIKDEFNIYFIDTDSFQIEGYPCPVGMIPYTRIKNHGKRYVEYLRDKNDDIFAVMTLIFQILLPGKLPYSFSGGGSEKENMKPENFSYRCYDGSTYINAPDGQWVYIWSHLPKKLKELFCRIFKNNESIQIEEAMQEIKSYIYQLKQGHQTDLIFPSSFKKIDRQGNVVNDENYKYKCISCGEDYFLTDSEKLFFEQKGLETPERCKSCRKNKKSTQYSDVNKDVDKSHSKTYSNTYRNSHISYSQSSTSSSTDKFVNDIFSFIRSLF